MGMDYSWSGSASYPRFDRELCAVAEVFGGVKTEYLRERAATESESTFGYWFGFLSSDNSDKAKFAFPKGTNETLVKWFNNIYDFFLPEEVDAIWEEVSKHPEIEEISWQIWHELQTLSELCEGWHIR